MYCHCTDWVLYTYVLVLLVLVLLVLQGERKIDPSWAKEYNPHAADSEEAIKQRAMSGGQPIKETADEGLSVDEWVAGFQVRTV